MLQFSLDFIKSHKKAFLLAFFLILFFVIYFLFVPIPDNLYQYFMNSIKEQVESVMLASPNKFYLFLNIFLNNFLASLMIFLSGFLLSVFGILIVVGNILVIELVLTYSIHKAGLMKTLLLILPHGVLELPAIYFSLVLAFILTYYTVKKLFYWKKVNYIESLKPVFKFYVFVVVPMILVAAFVEAFITILFAN